MIRVLFYIILVFLVAAGFAWLADRPGDVVLNWQGYEIRTSLMTAAVALLAIIVAIGIIGALLRAVFRAPHAFGSFLGARRRDRGYRALSTGMIAVGAGDIRTARRAADDARAHLGEVPLTLLLSAQAAQLAGEGAKARSAFEALAKQPETRLLGLHGLFIEARRQGDHEAARAFAEEAASAAPSIGWAGMALFQYRSRAGDWLGALQALSANQNARLVDKKEARRLRAVLLTAQAMEQEAGHPNDARIAALEAVRLDPSLAPAAVVAARLLARAGDYRRAARAVEQAWKVQPHPDLADAYAGVRPGDSVLDRLERVKRLASIRANHPEGAMAVARAAIDARDWSTARAAIEGLARAEPTERICLLMAEIEEREHGDEGRVRTWLTRAITAPRDPAWIADGHAYERWAPVSPTTGTVGAFTWAVPTESIPPREALEFRANLPAVRAVPAGPALPAVIAEPETSSAEPPTIDRESEAESGANGRMEPVSAGQRPQPEIMPAPIVEPIEELIPLAEERADLSAPAPEEAQTSAATPPPATAVAATPASSPATPTQPATPPPPDPAPAVDDAPEIVTPHPPDDPGPEPREESESASKRGFRWF